MTVAMSNLQNSWCCGRRKVTRSLCQVGLFQCQPPKRCHQCEKRNPPSLQVLQAVCCPVKWSCGCGTKSAARSGLASPALLELSHLLWTSKSPTTVLESSNAGLLRLHCSCVSHARSYKLRMVTQGCHTACIAGLLMPRSGQWVSHGQHCLPSRSHQVPCPKRHVLGSIKSAAKVLVAFRPP